MSEGEQSREAESLLRLASSDGPGPRVAPLKLGERVRAIRRARNWTLEEAAQRFEMVLELDPENERAARELADMRRQATQDRKGLLARLLGKKE